jgi:hypothetical protein
MLYGEVDGEVVKNYGEVVKPPPKVYSRILR